MKYSQFSLLTTVVPKVSRNTELANTELLCLRNQSRVWFLWASGYISIDQPIPSLVKWGFLLKDTLFNTRHRFINMELMANSTRTHAWMKLIEHTYFLHKVYHGLLSLENTLQHFSTTPERFFKQWNHHWKAQKCEKYGTR